MDDSTRQIYDAQSKDLRVKIKTWEALFQKEHNGSKPSKDDIKRNPKIGRYLSDTFLFEKQKQTSPSPTLDLAWNITDNVNTTAATYKEYQKLRNILDGKILPPQQGEDKENHRKRKSPNQPIASFTPSTKRFKQAETPSSRTHHENHAQLLGQYTPSGAATAVTPSLSRKLFSPVVPTSIGPTPQRDGRVLGIFDHLPFKDAEIDSPCKPNASAKVSQPNNNNEVAVQETPKKSTTTDAIALGRTPSSRHKQRQHQSPRKSLLATPLKPHDGNRVAKTPSTSSTVSRLQFATPAFLRRIPMAKITERSEYVSPEPIRLPRKPLLRGLSSVVADLRKLQEEQMDDDLDALREIENEAQGGSNVSNKNTQAPAKEAGTAPVIFNAGPEKTTKKQAEEEAAMLAADHISLLGGFDDEGQFDDPDGGEENAGRDRDGRPLKVYKKKGQKRTTRKSNMRPVRAKRPVAKEQEDTVVDETRDCDDPTDKRQQEKEEDPALLSGSDFAASDDDSDEDELAKDVPITSRKTGRKPASATNNNKAGNTTSQSKANKPEGTIKKAARKVNELAHANFKRLKLRNNGAKGGPGYNSRFRRRR